MGWYIGGGLLFLVLLFLWWQWTSVERGARQRDERIFPIIQPLVNQLIEGKAPSREEIYKVAAISYARGNLYQVLKHFERLDLFPDEYRDEISQAEATMVHWMLHPNELQDPPQKIERLETADRTIEGDPVRFYVFRYRMPPGHWAGTDWLLGVAGPFLDHEPPYSGIAGAFARAGDKQGDISPDELVDWYIARVGKVKNVD